MNENDRADLERLRKEQQSLEERLARVGLALGQEEERLRFANRGLDRLREEQTRLEGDSKVLLDKISVLLQKVGRPGISHQAVPPPLPPVLPQAVPPPVSPAINDPLSEATADSYKQQPSGESEERTSSPRPSPPLGEEREKQRSRSFGGAVGDRGSRKRGFTAEPGTTEAPEPKASFEMRLGTYWLVRIGIVMLLSGLVFLGNYAYKNFIDKLGPWGKISLLYVASGVLLGLGSWLGRKQEKLKNYAQVLFAGGLAALYFTTYAAYHIPTLQVITSPILDGALLLGLAGFMVWLATRHQSETLALFAVGLGYYTSIITNVGLFTLYSNVVLTIAAVFFLLSNRWATLTFGSLVATYAAYGYWRFYHGGSWHLGTPNEGLWTGIYFLMCYWVIFTSAVFFTRHKHFEETNRTAFLSLNNAAFFFLFLLTMLQVHQGGFYKFSLAYGSTLLVLAVAASMALKEDRLAANAYLTQGLLLVTLGFITKYTGLRLGLVLVVEAVALYVLSHLIKSRILWAGSLVSGALATFWTMAGMKSNEPNDLYLGCGVAALLLINNLVKQREWPSKELNQLARGLFAVAGSMVMLETTWDFCPEDLRTVVLLAEALALTFSLYLLSAREFVFCGQVFVVLSQLLCVGHLVEVLSPPGTADTWPWWSALVVGAGSLGLVHWWQRQKRFSVPPVFIQAILFFYALAVVGVIFCGLKPHLGPAQWLVGTALLGLAVTFYGIYSRAWQLAIAGQLFLVASCYEFVSQIILDPRKAGPGPYEALVPAVIFVGLAWFAAVILIKGNKAPETARRGIGALSVVYLWTAFWLFIGWTFEFIRTQERFWFLALAGALLFAAGGASEKSNHARLQRLL